MLRTILAVFFTIAVFAKAADKVTGHTKNWVSPNGSIRVEAKDFMRIGDEDHSNWDVLTFRDRGRQLIASLSLEEGSGISRAVVTEAIWSPDSRFFCFQTASSGGHSAWHVPLYVFDAKTARIYSVDDTIGSVTSDNSPLHFTHGDVLHVDLWNAKLEKDSDPTFFPREINLPQFVKTAKAALHSKRAEASHH